MLCYSRVFEVLGSRYVIFFTCMDLHLMGIYVNIIGWTCNVGRNLCAILVFQKSHDFAVCFFSFPIKSVRLSSFMIPRENLR